MRTPAVAILAAVLATAGCSSKATATAPPPAATTTTTATAHTPAPAGDGLTGLGAAKNDWDTSRNLDGDSPASSPGYGPDPNLPQINGRTGDKYTLLTDLNGYVTGYQVNFKTGTGITTALADVLHGEFPPDATWAWKHENTGRCYQAEVRSAALKAGFGEAGLGDGSGQAFVEFQTVVPGGTAPDFDASDVTYATVGIASYAAAGDAPGC